MKENILGWSVVMLASPLSIYVCTVLPGMC